MQHNLNDQYEKLKNYGGFSRPLSKRLSAPLCLFVPELWKVAKHRVLVVGQETLGWAFSKGNYYDWPYQSITSWLDFQHVPDSVEALIHGYKSFVFARYQPENYGSPFWRAYRQIREAQGNQTDGIETSVLWTNLFRKSLDGGSVMAGVADEVNLILNASRYVLVKEIEILKPTVIIFFTGRNYDEPLNMIFPDIKTMKFNDHDSGKASKLSHTCLPDKTWRTYHPKYLLLSGQWDIIEEITKELVK